MLPHPPNKPDDGAETAVDGAPKINPGAPGAETGAVVLLGTVAPNDKAPPGADAGAADVVVAEGKAAVAWG